MSVIIKISMLLHIPINRAIVNHYNEKKKRFKSGITGPFLYKANSRDSILLGNGPLQE